MKQGTALGFFIFFLVITLLGSYAWPIWKEHGLVLQYFMESPDFLHTGRGLIAMIIETIISVVLYTLYSRFISDLVDKLNRMEDEQ